MTGLWGSSARSAQAGTHCRRHRLRPALCLVNTFLAGEELGALEAGAGAGAGA